MHQRGELRKPCSHLPSALLAFLLFGAAVGGAVEVTGNARFSKAATEVNGTKSDLLDQQYSFTLFQRLTPYLTLRFGHQYFDLTTDYRDGGQAANRSRTPRLELLYNRPGISGDLSYQDRATWGSADRDRFHIRSLIGNISWQPSRGPNWALKLRKESNVADMALFGRQTDTLLVGLDTQYQRPHWSVGYSFQHFDLDSVESGLALREDRHQVQLDADRSFFADRLRVSFDSWLRRSERRTDVPAGSEIGDPVPATGGLFAIDTSPEVGELAPAPGLIDGNFSTPVPGIEIDGAKTYRNLGLDLSLNRPVAELEIAVDAPSGAGLIWQVYHSSDNLIWQEVGGVGATYDPDTYRYILRFPSTSDRYFKAVNVSVNTVTTLVRVTEIRALVNLRAEGSQGSSTVDYFRSNLSVSFRPNARLSTTVNVGASRDSSLTGALTQRDLRDRHATARVEARLPASMALHLAFDYYDFEDRVAAVLTRTEKRANASLSWKPLTTLESVLSVTRQDELDRDQRIRLIDTARLQVLSELLPGLRLVSALERSQIDEALAGERRTTFVWRESLQARPTEGWTIAGGYARLRYELVGNGRLLDREELELRTTWAASPLLTLSGGWDYSLNNDRSSLRQRYSFSYSPSSKLSLSASYDELEDEFLRSTVSSSVNITYRLNPRFNVFAISSRSAFDDQGVSTDIASVRLGCGLFF